MSMYRSWRPVWRVTESRSVKTTLGNAIRAAAGSSWKTTTCLVESSIPTTRSSACVRQRAFRPDRLKSMVMMFEDDSLRRSLWLSMKGLRSMLEATSPETRMNGSDSITPRWSRSRITSPAEVQTEELRISMLIRRPHPLLSMYSRIFSAWLMQKTNTCLTSFDARNSSVYAIRGALPRGKRTFGVSKLTGRKVEVKESAKRTACKGLSLFTSSSPPPPPPPPPFRPMPDSLDNNLF
mmetsp:Transcript_69546/g.157237  ORF Transcript_69546/g.157237 Transcript_69546/m.157237 type:complete len:237 (+) Transcript_69546:403-1113(+)